MYKRYTLLITLIVLVVLSLPVLAQDDLPLVEVIPISGTFSYTYEILHMGATENFVIQHARENEIWSGDLDGTAEAVYFLEFWESPPQLRGSFLIEFTGSLLGEYEGTLTMIMAGSGIANPMLMDMESQVPFGVTGEFRIISGTGDFENVYGYGQWWGPGNAMNDPDHNVPDIAYQGEIMFMEPSADS